MQLSIEVFLCLRVIECVVERVGMCVCSRKRKFERVRANENEGKVN